MGTAGRIGGLIGGAVLGVIFAPAGAWAAGAAVSGWSYAALGASVGSMIGGVLDPPRPGSARAQHEIRSVLYPTFENNLVVPLLFGTFRITGNIIFVGDTYGAVEDVGTETVGQGKSEQQVEVLRTIYYADFVMAFGEGPFRAFGKTFVDDVDRSAEEGRLFTYLSGADDEEIPDVVLSAPIAPAHPTPWHGTAKLVWSGKIGEVNHLPSIVTIATGPETKTIDIATPTGLPATVRRFMHDDLSGRYVTLTGDRTFMSFLTDGSSPISGEVPTILFGPTVIERLYYDGRSDRVLAAMTPLSGRRWLWFGELSSTLTTDDWTLMSGAVTGWGTAISAAAHDDGASMLYTVHVTSTQTHLVRTSFRTGLQDARILDLGVTGLAVRALAYDKPSKFFYLLYTRSGELRVRRFTWDGMEFDAEDQLVDYTWVNPIGIALVGRMVSVFDAGAEQPIVQMEWGRTHPRFRRGFLYNVANFTPDLVEDLGIWLDAASIAQSNNTFVSAWSNPIAPSRSAVQTDSATGEKPKYFTGVVNGKPVVRFDGTNDYLKIVTAGFVRNDCTVFIVHKPDVTGTGHRTLLYAKDDGLDDDAEAPVHYAALGGTGVVDPDAPTAELGEVGKVWVSEGGTLVANCSYAARFGVFSLHCTRVDSETMRTYLNGDLQGSGQAPQPNETDQTVWIGRQGLESVGFGFYKGDIAEIIVYDRALDDEERTKVEGYLQRKYGIEWNAALPAYLYYALGDRLTFSAPSEFWYAPELHRLMVLDQSTTGWWLFAFHWNGDNWSYLQRTRSRYVRYEEESSCVGALRLVATSEDGGAGLPTSTFNDQRGDRVSGFCNAPVDMRFYTDDETTFEARYRLNYYLASQKNLSQVVREMLASFGAFLVYESGMIGVYVERDAGVIDFDFGADQIVFGSFSFWEIGRDDRYNRVDVEFFDERKNYKSHTVPVTAEWDRDRYGEVRRTGLSAQGCTRPRQAVILGLVSLHGFTFRRFACKFRTGAQGLANVVGDVGYITHPDPRWDKKKMLVVEMREGEDEEIEFTCIEYVAAIHDAEGYPLEEPVEQIITSDGTDESFSDVKPLARVFLLEDTLEGRLFLLASPSAAPGPLRSVRWWAEWNAAATPGATFYPGAAALSETAYTSVLATQVTTPSGVLHSGITATDLTFVLDALTGEPPEANFDILLYDPSMTAGDFGNPNGNGHYERMQGLTFDPATRTVVLHANGRGYGTNAVAHANAEYEVKATYVRPGGAGPNAAPVVRYWDQSVHNSSVAPAPLSNDGAEWYIAFSTTGFGAPGYPSSLPITINLTIPPFVTLTDPLFAWKIYYSSAEGEWTEITQVTDGTFGFSADGDNQITFQPPADGLWTAVTHWKPSGTNSTFVGYGGANPTPPAARYYLKIVRVSTSSQVSLTPDVQVTGQASYYAVGRRAAIAFFITNKTPFYDLAPAEQGYALKWKAQPVGAHGQTIDLAMLPAVDVTVYNLSGEAGA